MACASFQDLLGFYLRCDIWLETVALDSWHAARRSNPHRNVSYARLQFISKPAEEWYIAARLWVSVFSSTYQPISCRPRLFIGIGTCTSLKVHPLIWYNYHYVSNSTQYYNLSAGCQAPSREKYYAGPQDRGLRRRVSPYFTRPVPTRTFRCRHRHIRHLTAAEYNSRCVRGHRIRHYIWWAHLARFVQRS